MYDVRMDFNDLEALNASYERMTFGLTYAHTPKRVLSACGIDGPPLPDADEPLAKSPGDWSCDVQDWEDNPFLQIFSSAIGEAVHEALEWCKVDGKPMLNPHGWKECDIYSAVAELVYHLWDMVDHDSLGIDK